MNVQTSRALLAACVLLIGTACHRSSHSPSEPAAMQGNDDTPGVTVEALVVRDVREVPAEPARPAPAPPPAAELREESRRSRDSLVSRASEKLRNLMGAGASVQSLSGTDGPSLSLSAARPAHSFEQEAKRSALPPARDGNRFQGMEPNPYVRTADDALSTFAIDVDTASYSVSRRYLMQGALPPADAVRVEEFLNAFTYRYPAPRREPFSVHLEGAPSPLTSGRTLLKVGVQGRQVSRADRKPANLVFLVDTSGSMNHPDKLPLAIDALKLLVKNLNEHDTIALTTYAGSTRDVLPPTPATEYTRIYRALDSLRSGGGTAMGAGLTTAYAHALKGAGSGRNSRVIVLTDGDANLGRNLTPDAMLESVKAGVEEGVTLTTIGLGMGNYRDDLLERLANRGNGNAFYIDSMKEARRVFETRLAGTLEVIAKDVKIQVEFNPKAVSGYRLLGYENRDIADEDFRDDKVDAGEIGAGHSVTALYEVALTGKDDTLATVRVRAKAPTGTRATESAFTFGRDRLSSTLEGASPDLRFAAAVAMTAEVLRRAPDSESISLERAHRLAKGSIQRDEDRAEFVKLLESVQQLSSRVALSPSPAPRHAPMPEHAY